MSFGLNNVEMIDAEENGFINSWMVGVRAWQADVRAPGGDREHRTLFGY